MSRRIFGTDGVRGRANVYPMTASNVVDLAMAVGAYFNRDQKRHRVVIGKDTRRSCYMLENALTAGFTAAGMDVFALGPVPTPAVGRLTHSMRADIGVMISASHNPYHDNGIKFFGPDGFKLSDEAEAEIEAAMEINHTPDDTDRYCQVVLSTHKTKRDADFKRSARLHTRSKDRRHHFGRGGMRGLKGCGAWV